MMIGKVLEAVTRADAKMLNLWGPLVGDIVYALDPAFDGAHGKQLPSASAANTPRASSRAPASARVWPYHGRCAWWTWRRPSHTCSASRCRPMKKSVSFTRRSKTRTDRSPNSNDVRAPRVRDVAAGNARGADCEGKSRGDVLCPVTGDRETFRDDRPPTSRSKPPIYELDAARGAAPSSTNPDTEIRGRAMPYIVWATPDIAHTTSSEELG